MKKIFILLTTLAICIISVCAYSYPRWRSMPIHVYVPEYGKYSTMMVKAFDAWQQKSNGLVKFKYVSRQSEADIFVEFVDYVRNCGTESAVGCTHSSTRGGFYVQNYIEIGTKDSTITMNRNGKFEKTESTRSKEHLYGVMIHEIGHAIGLKHTDNKDSIMYPIDLNELQYITNNDIESLKTIYR